MSKILLSAGVLGLWLLGGTAHAGTVVQTLQMTQNQIDGSPYNISGDNFNTALGTLVSVTETFNGTYTPDILGVTGTFNNPVTAKLAGAIFVGSNGNDNYTNTDFANLSLSLSGNSLVGNPVTISDSTAFSFTDLAAFEGAGSNVANLLEFSFSPQFSTSLGTPSDASTFDGTLTLTYTYQAAAVPEPASAALLALGAVVLLFTRRAKLFGQRA